MSPFGNMKNQALLCALIGAALGMGFQTAQAMNPFSKSAGEAYRNLPEAKKGGAIFLNLIANPSSLSPLTNYDTRVWDVVDDLYVPFMFRDYDTGEYFPLLAEKVDVSRDHKVMTFTLRKDAVWDDGTPITSDDVEFTFQKLMDPKTNAAHKRVYFEDFTFEKVDPQTVRFKVTHPNVNTLVEINDDFRVIQKKQFVSEPDFNKARGILSPVSSGPYRLKSFQRDQKLELERKKDWWGYKVVGMKNLFNFDTIVYRIISDPSLSYEKFVKGEIDLLEMNAEVFGTRVKGADKDKYGPNPETDKPLWAKHFETRAPALTNIIGWNLKRPLFQSKKTRQALAQLVNYDEILNKIYYGEAVRSFSPFGSNTPNTAPEQKKKTFQFDPAKAIALLKEDGWADDGQGVLTKMIDGKKTRFEFTLRYNSENPMRAKIAQVMREQFKKAGIVLNVQALEYNTLVETMQNRDFDALVMGWGKGNLYQDSKQIWHSSSWENRGSNFVGYSNPEADKLIEEATNELDIQKHFKLNQKLAAIIYDDQPCVFLLEVPGFFAAFQSSKIRSKKWVMKYDETIPVWMYSAQ